MIVLASQFNHILAHEHAEHFALRLLTAPLLGGLVLLAAGAALPERGRQAFRRLGARLAPYEPYWLPGLAFALFALYILGYLESRTDGVWEKLLYAPWDVGHYKRLILTGYGFFSEHGRPVNNFCWLPAFPLLGRGLLRLTGDVHWAALSAAWLAAIAAFYALYALAASLFSRGAARWSLAALACFPTSFYLLIGFPYGLSIALGCLYALAVFRDRPFLAFWLGMGLSLTYPSSVLAGLLAVMAYTPRLFEYEGLRRNGWRLLAAGGGVGLGPLLLFAYFQAKFGDFFAFWGCQARYERSWTWPWLTVERSLLASGFYDVFILPIWLIAAGIAIFWHKSFRPALWVLLLATFLLSPATGSLEASYRHYLALWPFFLLVGNADRPWWFKAVFFGYTLYIGAYYYLPLWIDIALV